ncbi:MAG: hypothetical protein M3422_13200 [Actinomycetota bacterium]|nr:hypothetical protein [Actinomycetota bacterium]
MSYEQPKSRANLIAILVIVVVLVVGAVIAIVVATTGGDDGGKAAAPTPTSTANAAEVRVAQARDDALADGRAAVEVFNTLDYRHVDEDLDRWESVATGALLTQLTEGRASAAAQIRQVKSVTTAEILDAALSEFDEAKGKATLLAAVSVEVTLPGQEPTTKRMRLVASLDRDGDDWKVSDLHQAV